jgi:hypothetical protein
MQNCAQLPEGGFGLEGSHKYDKALNEIMEKVPHELKFPPKMSLESSWGPGSLLKILASNPGAFQGHL